MIDGGCNPYVKCAHSIHLSDTLMQISKTACLYAMAANCKNSDPLNRIDQLSYSKFHRRCTQLKTVLHITIPVYDVLPTDL